MSTADELAKALHDEAGRAGLSLPADALAAATRHAVELLAWNAGANLTRLTTPVDVARRHFVESFLAARVLPEATPDGLRVLDVGAGGGFPGLALRLVRPDLALTLLEPKRRKAAFLRHVAGLQPPPHATVLALRLEELAETEVFDAITFRAVRLGLDVLLAHLSPQGRIVGFPGEEDPTLEADMLAAGLEEQASTLLPGGRRRVVAWSRPPG